MEIFRKSVRLSLSMVILVILCILFITAIIVYFQIDKPDSKWGTLFGSLAAGMIVAIIQYAISWQDYRQTEKLKKLQLLEVLFNRDSRDKYEEYIRNANRKLDVMGVTAVRFFNDFADMSNGALENAQVLLRALNRGVYVRVLLVSKELLSESKKVDYAKVRTKYKEIIQRYPNIEIRYFNHIAAHSIFRIDDTCIVGPVFPNLESKNTPALHVMKSSPIALHYMDYFEKEWKDAKKE